MKSPLVSIIVPIYNSSKYLCKCLDSIVGQSYTNIEILLVDDGSTDDSLKICNSYSVSDSRIRVIHQSNQGPVAARKTGVDYCSGDYIMFVDSDDWVNQNMCSKLLKRAEKTQAELVICDFIIYWDNIEKYYSCEFTGDSYDILHKLIAYKYPTSLWNKLYNKQLVIKSMENCTIGDDICEDFLMSVSCFMLSPKISFVPEALYFYNRCVNSSLVLNLNTLGKTLYAGKNNINKTYSLLMDVGLFEEYKYDFYRLVLDIKTYLLNEGRFSEAREFYSDAHKKMQVFHAISNPYRWFYYGALNWGWFGEHFFKIYILGKSLLKRKV